MHSIGVPVILNAVIKKQNGGKRKTPWDRIHVEEFLFKKEEHKKLKGEPELQGQEQQREERGGWGWGSR